jgi:hypothetical protein
MLSPMSESCSQKRRLLSAKVARAKKTWRCCAASSCSVVDSSKTSCESGRQSARGWISAQRWTSSFVCGAGLEATKNYLASQQSEAAAAALKYLAECERAGDFEDFSPVELLADYRHYFDPT